jgi:ATP-binding cassette subfamily B protein
MSDADRSRRAARGRLWRAIAFVRPHRGAAAAIGALTLTVGALNASEPLVLKSLLDALGLGASDALTRALGALVAIGLVRELCGATSNWLTWRTRLRVHHRLLEATVGRLHLLPVGFHAREGVGALMTRLDRGIQGFVGALNELAFQVLPAFVYLILSVLVMLRLDWELALLVLGFAPVPALTCALAAPSQIRRERTLFDAWARIYSRFNEVLSGISTVKSFVMEEEEQRRFLGDVRRANRVVVRGVGFDSGVGAAQNLVVTLARAASLAVGALLVGRGEITIGTLVAFLGYLGGLFGPIQALSGAYRTLRAASVSIDTIFAILDAHDRIDDAPEAEDPGAVRGAVSFEGVQFRYASSAPILDGIDLEVAPGEQVAIVGPSGSGKTTLMALLQRFYDRSRGSIKVDGKDLKQLKQRALRRNIGVVLQDALLFNETVRDNLAYGRPQAAYADIEAAARAANAHEFILRLPDGYDTLVGERGCRLSAGERQRLAIARAVLKDPPILILDEATWALDAETERLVQRALERLIKGRTTFVIAHRLSTVVQARRIVVLRDGRIAETGSHRELMETGGYYARLVRQQTEGLLDGR